MEVCKTLYLSQASDDISGTVPILFWDTCALLDILRIPIRSKQGKQTLQNYERVLEYIHDEQIVSVTSGLVIKELEYNYYHVRQELLDDQQHLKKKVYSYANCLEETAQTEGMKSSIDSLDVEPILTRLLEQILKKTFVIREENIYKDFADYRVRNKIAPAERKPEYKDCYIWGTFLELIHHIKPETPCVAFMTTNTEDYSSDKKKQTLFPQIERDCNYKDSMRVCFQVGKLVGNLHTALETVDA